MINSKTFLSFYLLLLLIIETMGNDKKTSYIPGPEGWDGFGTHITMVCNIHPFIYSFQTGLRLLLNDDDLEKYDEDGFEKKEGINTKGTLSRSAPISWIAANYAIHSILPIGFKKSRETTFIDDLNRIKPVVDRKSAINAEKNLSRIEDMLDTLCDTSKIDSIKEINTFLYSAVENIREMLEPFSQGEIEKDIDQYELDDTCFSFEAFGAYNLVIQCSEELLHVGADYKEIIGKNMRLLKMLVEAARKK
jgi:hypothetical protein